MRLHRFSVVLALALALALVGCSHGDSALAQPAPPPARPSPSSPPLVSRRPPAADAGPAAPAPSVAAPEPTFEELANLLYAGSPDLRALAAACAPSTPSEARTRCLFEERYRGDARAAHLATELFVRWHIPAGVEVAHTMDGGYRGMIRIEPALPLQGERRHLEWIVDAFRDFDRFWDELDRAGGGAGDAGARPRYRWRPLTVRFLRSVAARTPSAYAADWSIGWNLNGSLNTSADAVRETLFHEIFHLNDESRSASWWSPGVLGATFDAIVRKCGTRAACLAPYTPNETMVRGGTYYSFQPGNGVREYAAELALRYYREQRTALRARPLPKPFKCGPPENQASWAAMRDEFFGGIDVVPAC